MPVLRLFVLLLGVTITACFFALSSTFAQQDQGGVPTEQEVIPAEGDLISAEQEGVPADGDTIQVKSAQEDLIEEEVFFDADNLVPQGQMAQVGPIKVDPKTQPASKLIVVKKNYSPDTKQAHLVSAERAMQLGRYDSALELFDILYDKNKKDSRVLMGRAIVLQKLGRFDESMGMYEELSKIEPSNVEAKVNMLGLLSTRYPSVALRRLLDLHEQNRSNVGLTAQVGLCYARLGDMESAARYLGMVASMEPNNASHVYNLAVIADRMGDKAKAISYYEKALEVDSVGGTVHTVPREDIYERLANIR